MSASLDSHVAVIGAGVLGLSVAAELSRRGARCTVIDPSPLGDNASGVSAGMLAPAFEGAEARAGAQTFALLQDARDLWPAFACAVGADPPDRSGAAFVPDDAEALQQMALALERQGAATKRLDDAAVERLQPGLVSGGCGGLFTPEDWRLDPGPLLQALAAAIVAAGGRLLRVRANGLASDRVELGREVLSIDAAVVCAGFDSEAFSAAVPEVSILRPVKGQRLRFTGAGPRSGAVVRSERGYVVPSADGAIAGATMEAGLSDRRPTEEATAALRAMAVRLFPTLAGGEAEAAAGVRAETPDGLPLVGRSTSGVFLAAGARRNGWLLAPLAAAVIADAIAGTSEADSVSSRWADALRPDRF